MQTFVPYPNLLKSASVLDNKRLNKQLLEGRQIYKILSEDKKSGAWVNHPAVKMWRNFDMGLYSYLLVIKDECVFRGISTQKNWDAITEMHKSNWNRGNNSIMPHWWGDEKVHQSHRNNLYNKNKEHYSKFINDSFVSCCEKCNYFWPTHTEKYNESINDYRKDKR
jgi:hypothetical protein